MHYSTDLLHTVAECDQLLAKVNKLKDALLAKQARLLFIRAQYMENSIEIETEISVVHAELAFLDTILPGMPEGDKKEGYLQDKRRHEIRLFQLDTQKAKKGTLALLDKEHELAEVENTLSEADLLIAALNVRKAELE